ncbi:MAG: BspA family leucine-rich repeat surface protein, partial [Chryseobacterium sp.]
MSHMFQGATSFNKDIGTWKTRNVWNMNNMFQGATSFNKDIGTWKTGKVTDMSHMFEGATSFNKEIGTWDTDNVSDMNDMFKGATSFDKEKPKCDIINTPYDEVPSRISSELHMMIPPIESTTTLRGTPLIVMIGMLYLLHKYPEYCVVIPPSADYIESSLYGWNELTLRWKESYFDIPDGFWDSVKECLEKKPKPTFIIMPFGFTGHSNYLIYDSKTKELERFEPNGFISGETYNPPNLEKKLKHLFNYNVQPGMVDTVYGPLSFCPRKSFQALQHSEGEQKEGDPGGFCTAWSAWYADTRLANPNKTRKQVVEMALKKFKDEPGSMTQYIRSYSFFITKAGELLRKSNDPATVFRLLIEQCTYS